MPFSLYCSTLPSHTLLLQAGVLPLPHSRVLSWSLLFFFTNPTPVRPTYPFPPLFAACLSRLTLSRQAFECPISCLLDPSVFPSIRAARTPQNHAWLCRCYPHGKRHFCTLDPLAPSILLQLALRPSQGAGQESPPGSHPCSAGWR